MQILLVEDEKKVADFLEEALRSEGYQVELASSWENFSNELVSPSHKYDVLVLDRSVDDRDTLTEMNSVKRVFPQAKILFLSALNSAHEKATALDAGADDYLGKPYAFSELAARIRALSRRSAPASSQDRTKLQQGKLLLDLLEHQAYVAGKRLDLTNKEFQVLSCLMNRPGQVFNKYQLLDRVWDRQVDLESNVVEVTIKNVRRKLEDAIADVTISSKRNIGYWIEK